MQRVVTGPELLISSLSVSCLLRYSDNCYESATTPSRKAIGISFTVYMLV